MADGDNSYEGDWVNDIKWRVEESIAKLAVTAMKATFLMIKWLPGKCSDLNLNLTAEFSGGDTIFDGGV